MNKELGFNGETSVLNKLLAEGYELVVRNYSIHNVGELDLVMRKNDVVYVIEVKARLFSNTSNWGSPELAVNSNKLRKIKNTTRYLIRQYHLEDYNIVFMVGTVLHDKLGNVVDVDVFEI